MTKAGFVYIMASRRNGTLYLGVTNDLVRRVWEHRNSLGDGFSALHGCTLLAWYEAHDDLQEARAKELRMKKWKRSWKLELIEASNPEWHDLWDRIVA